MRKTAMSPLVKAFSWSLLDNILTTEKQHNNSASEVAITGAELNSTAKQNSSSRALLCKSHTAAAASIQGDRCKKGRRNRANNGFRDNVNAGDGHSKQDRISIACSLSTLFKSSGDMASATSRRLASSNVFSGRSEKTTAHSNHDNGQ